MNMNMNIQIKIAYVTFVIPEKKTVRAIEIQVYIIFGSTVMYLPVALYLILKDGKSSWIWYCCNSIGLLFNAFFGG